MICCNPVQSYDSSKAEFDIGSFANVVVLIHIYRRKTSQKVTIPAALSRPVNIKDKSQ